MDTKEVLEKYSRELGKEMPSYRAREEVSGSGLSRDYSQFKEDMLPALSRYERLVKRFGTFIRLKLAEKDRAKFQSYLDVAHLSVSPGSVVGLAVFSFLIVFLIGVLTSVAWWFLTGSISFLFLILVFATGGFLFYYFYTLPKRLATLWRLKASSQMVHAILYTVIYMKHTSNLERALHFVSQHIEPPLALDMRKVLWDVETGRYSTVKDSLDAYLAFWRGTNNEFVESFHLIESSLYEPSEARRIQVLERALQVILDGVYEKMLQYTHSIKAPLTNVYMLGIVLPTLGLALLPLVSTLLGGMIQWIHVIVLFNILVPFFVFYLTVQIMLLRPGGYGETSLLQKNPLYRAYISKRPYVIAGLIAGPFFLLGLLPLLFGYTPLPLWIGLSRDVALAEIGLGIFGSGMFFGFVDTPTGIVGPFGLGALLLSLFVPFSLSLFFSLSFSMRTKALMKARNATKVLEKEFTSSLFTLGNRLGDGTPAEIAFSKVAASTKGQQTSEFFQIVNANIQTMGMSLDEALFNPRRGALVYYPSALVATSMRILVESVKKGLDVAAQSLMSISQYVRSIQKIQERLQDLLADVSSDMQSNMTFLAPLLAGIVIGLAAMITGILGQLKALTDLGVDTSLAGVGSISNLTQLFDIVNMIPPYFLQIAIGIYLIQIVFILTRTLVTIDAGDDALQQTHMVGKHLMRSSVLYLITALVSILSLALLSGIALSGIGG